MASCRVDIVVIAMLVIGCNNQAGPTQTVTGKASPAAGVVLANPETEGLGQPASKEVVLPAVALKEVEAPSNKITISVVKAPNEDLLRDVGLDFNKYQVSVPANTEVTAWFEVYDHGKLVEAHGAYNLRGFRGLLEVGHPWDSIIKFTRYRPQSPPQSPEVQSKSKWTLTINGTGPVIWLETPLRKFMPQFGLSSPGGTARSEMEIGQPVILWYRLGKDGDSASFNDTTFKKHLKENDLTEYAFAAILWCKFEKSEVKANRSGSFTGVPK